MLDCLGDFRFSKTRCDFHDANFLCWLCCCNCRGRCPTDFVTSFGRVQQHDVRLKPPILGLPLAGIGQRLLRLHDRQFCWSLWPQAPDAREPEVNKRSSTRLERRQRKHFARVSADVFDGISTALRISSPSRCLGAPTTILSRASSITRRSSARVAGITSATRRRSSRWYSG